MKRNVQYIFKNAGIMQKEVARRSGRSDLMVSKVLRGIERSRFIEAAAYELLQERMGQQCPPFDEVFDVR